MDELGDHMGPFDELDMEESPSQSGYGQQPAPATNVTFADEDTLAELISKARAERSETSAPSSKGDESHLRSFFVHAEQVKKDALALPEHKQLFDAVPDMDLQNVEQMQQVLYSLFRTDEQRFCQQLVHYISSIRKRNKGHIGERFPLKTLDHKIRRLATYIVSEHARELREGLVAPRDINLLDPGSPVWSQLVDTFKQQGRERGEEYEVSELELCCCRLCDAAALEERARGCRDACTAGAGGGCRNTHRARPCARRAPRAPAAGEQQQRAGSAQGSDGARHLHPLL